MPDAWKSFTERWFKKRRTRYTIGWNELRSEYYVEVKKHGGWKAHEVENYVLTGRPISGRYRTIKFDTSKKTWTLNGKVMKCVKGKVKRELQKPEFALQLTSR